MLLSFLTPLADLRPFTTDFSGRLERPDWALPDQTDFVRSFGPMRLRRLGAGDDFLREGWFCDVANAVQPACKRGRDETFAGLSTFYSRLYFDGIRALTQLGDSTDFTDDGDVGALTGGVAGKLEVGLIFRSSVLTRRQTIMEDLIRSVARSPATAGTADQTRPLSRLGNSVAETLQTRTTSHAMTSASGGSKLVQAGELLTICHAKACERLVLPRNAIRLATPPDARHELWDWRHISDGISVRTLFIIDRANGGRHSGRLLRLYLMRLHIEHATMRAVLRGLKNPAVSGADDPARQRLQLYLRDGLRRIAQFSRASSQVAGHETGELARYAEKIIKPREQAALIEQLRHMNIRPNIVRNVQAYINKERLIAINIGSIDMSTHNTNVNTGSQGSLQQSGAGSTQEAQVRAFESSAGIAEQLAALTELLDRAKGEAPPAVSAQAAKSLAHLKTELQTEGAEPDKNVITGALGHIADLAKVAGKYAVPIGQVVDAIRKLTGL